MTQHAERARLAGSGESGGAMVILLVSVMMPLIVLVGAAVSSMVGRTGRLLAEIHGEKAMQAAEAGIDEALYRSAIGTLDINASVTSKLGPSLSCVIDTVDLSKDGKDSDGDSIIDEIDETMLMLTVTGRYRSIRKRLRAFMPLVVPPAVVPAAVGVLNTGIQIQLDGGAASIITGHDKNLDGSNGPGVSQPGMSIKPPGTAATLTGPNALDTASERNKVSGAGGTPSLGVLPNYFDVPDIIDQVEAAPDVTLGAAYNNLVVGDSSLGDYKHIVRNGDLQLTGTCKLSGIIVVTGTVQFADNCTIDGLLIVMGNVNFSKNVKVRGGLVIGGNQLYMSDSSSVQYSTQATQGAMSRIVIEGAKTKPVAPLLSWQQIPVD